MEKQSPLPASANHFGEQDRPLRCQNEKILIRNYHTMDQSQGRGRVLLLTEWVWQH